MLQVNSEFSTEQKKWIVASIASLLTENRLFESPVIGHCMSHSTCACVYTIQLLKFQFYTLPGASASKLNEDSSLQWHQTGSKRKVTMMDNFGYYIPILGAVYRWYATWCFFKEHPTALQIIGFYDDVEVTNPLGLKMKKQSRFVLFRSC